MNNCGWGYTPHPKRKIVQRLLVHGMCDFEDGTRAARRRAIAQNGVAAKSIAHIVIQSVAWESPK